MRLAWTAALLLLGCGQQRAVPITVSGTVVAGSYQLVQPVKGALVSLAGRPAVATDAEGRFSVEGVEPPYTALAGDPQHGFAAAWLGLRRSDPVLVLDVDQALPWRSAGANGFVSGLPVDGMNPARAYLETPIGAPASLQVVNPAYGDYSAGAYWLGPESITGTVHVLQTSYQPLLGDIITATGFPLYGRIDGVPLTSGQTTRDVNFALAPLASTQARVRVSFPPAPPGSRAEIWVVAHYGSWAGVGFLLASFRAPQPWPDFAVPALPGIRVHVWATAWVGLDQTNEHRTMGWEGGDLDVRLDPPPRLLEPADGAVDVGPGTRFSWSPLASADVHVLEAYVGGPAPVRLQVIVEGGAAALPDFSAVGVPLPGAQSGSWWVKAMAPAGGVDGMASLEHLGLSFSSGGGESDFTFGQTWGQGFTTR